MRARGRVRAVVVATGAALAVLAAAPQAAGQAPAVRLAVQPGWSGRFSPGAAIPVQVDVTAARLVNGSLEIGGGVEPAVRLPVEVAGGTTKRVAVTVTVPQGAGDSARVRVALSDGAGRVVASATADVRAAGDEELVGILPGALAGRPVPATAPLSVDVGTARFWAVDERMLDGGARALDALSTLVAAPDEMARLTPSRQSGVRRWVAAGGRLLVDAAPGTRVAGLPDAWQPVAGRAAGGLGEVVATNGAVEAGRWQGLVDPSARGVGGGGGPQLFGGPTSLADALARDADLRLVRLGGLLAFLAAYIALVGPVAFVALRRRGRAELAWVVVPLVAVVFTTGGWAFGRSLRGDAVLSHGTVIGATADGPAQVTSFLGVTARTAGARSIALPSGWWSDVAPRGFDHDGFGRGEGRVTAELVGDGERVHLPLATGQFGVVGMQGTDGRVDGETLRLSVQVGADDVARGTVTNVTPWPLDEVAVFLGPRVQRVGSLAAGASAAVVLPPAGDGAGGEPVSHRAWPRYTGFAGPPELDGPVNLALWNALSPRVAPGAGTSGGAVVAAGWTDRYAPPVRVGGRVAKGRTAVVGRALVQPGQPLSAVASRYEVLRGVRVHPAEGGISTDGRIVVRLDVPAGIPPGVDVGKLRAHVPFSGQPVEVWDGMQWREVEEGIDKPRRPEIGRPSPEGVPAPIPVPGAAIAEEGLQFVDVPLPPGALTPAGVFLRMLPDGPLLGVAGVGLLEAQA